MFFRFLSLRIRQKNLTCVCYSPFKFFEAGQLSNVLCFQMCWKARNNPSTTLDDPQFQFSILFVFRYQFQDISKDSDSHSYVWRRTCSVGDELEGRGVSHIPAPMPGIHLANLNSTDGHIYTIFIDPVQTSWYSGISGCNVPTRHGDYARGGWKHNGDWGCRVWRKGD